MDLSKKRDELNPYIEQYGYAEVFNKGFDAAVEILSAEIKELDRLFRLAREQRNKAEDRVKELEKALEFYADKENWEYTPYDHDGQFRNYCTIVNDLSLECGEGGGIDYAGKRARETLSKLRGGK